MDYVLENSREHPAIKALREEVEKREHAIMMGSPDEATFFSWLIPALGIKKAIEIGVFRGSTTLAIALALPEDGKVIGLDVSAEYAEIGQKYWKSTGVDNKIDFRVGPAIEALDKIINEENGAGTFDFIFIDADKTNYDHYYERALVLVKPGKGIIAVDNVLWDGTTYKPKPDADASTLALSRLNDKIKADKRVQPMMLPIADGVTLCRKL
jgi:predicted O-methyltransferase YrrM